MCRDSNLIPGTFCFYFGTELDTGLYCLVATVLNGILDFPGLNNLRGLRHS